MEGDRKDRGGASEPEISETSTSGQTTPPTCHCCRGPHSSPSLPPSSSYLSNGVGFLLVRGELSGGA